MLKKCADSGSSAKQYITSNILCKVASKQCQHDTIKYHNYISFKLKVKAQGDQQIIKCGYQWGGPHQ